MSLKIQQRYFNKNYFSSGVYDTYKEDSIFWAERMAKKIISFVGDFPVPKILDIGCAHGFLMAELHEKYGADVFGLEYSDYACRNAELSIREKIKKGSVLEKNLFIENSFDAVLCFDVFEYLSLPEVKIAVANMAYWTKNLIFFSSIYKHSPQNSQKLNPDKNRITTLTEKEYISVFNKNQLKFFSKFTDGGGNLVFRKNK